MRKWEKERMKNMNEIIKNKKAVVIALLLITGGIIIFGTFITVEDSLELQLLSAISDGSLLNLLNDGSSSWSKEVKTGDSDSLIYIGIVALFVILSIVSVMKNKKATLSMVGVILISLFNIFIAYVLVWSYNDYFRGDAFKISPLVYIPVITSIASLVVWKRHRKYMGTNTA